MTRSSRIGLCYMVKLSCWKPNAISIRACVRFVKIFEAKEDPYHACIAHHLTLTRMKLEGIWHSKSVN